MDWTKIMYRNNILIEYNDTLSYMFDTGYSDLYDFYTKCEIASKKYMASIIQRDWNVIDVGANIGMYSALFAMMTDGDVFLIEASDVNFDILQKNMQNVNTNSNIHYINQAVGNSVEEKYDTIHYLWTGNGSVKQDTRVHKFNTIDNLLLDYDKKIHLIKIDVDGFDFQVLLGAKNVILRDSPIIMFELMEETLSMAGYCTKDVYNFFSEVGYVDYCTLDGVNHIFKKDETCI